MTIAALGYIAGFLQRAWIERGVRADYRELFRACRLSMRADSEYGPGSASALPAANAARPVSLGLLGRRKDRCKTTEFVKKVRVPGQRHPCREMLAPARERRGAVKLPAEAAAQGTATSSGTELRQVSAMKGRSDA